MDPFGTAIFALLIPIVALSIPIFAIYYHYKRDQGRRQERMLAIEKGIELPPEMVEHVKQPLKTMDYLRRGLLSLAVGIGLGIGGTLVRGVDEDFAGLATLGGIIVFLVGIALLIYYNILNKREEQ
ncbi:hypothetical protein KAW18_00815 [candidate division WOR-3 bacterium]|nr:hypothetical protein [candidate division WOR-3 bacterium]MCK4525881.1 hypothetical protein [candidate division WOR-3 bacterium]